MHSACAHYARFDAPEISVIWFALFEKFLIQMFKVSVVEHPLPSVALYAADARHNRHHRHNPVFEGDYLYVIHMCILQ
jgi:hypothetical protein